MKPVSFLGIFLFLGVIFAGLASATVLTIDVVPLDNSSSVTPYADYNYTFVLSQGSDCISIANATTVLTMNSTGGAEYLFDVGNLQGCGLYYCEYRNNTLRSIQQMNISLNGGFCQVKTQIIIQNGSIGVNGQNGTNGLNGTNGANGTNGIDGQSSMVSVLDLGGGVYKWLFYYVPNDTNYGNFTTANLTGPPGGNGTNGMNGSNGVNGLNGSIGATGATGATGSSGPAGSNGSNGVNGLNGSNGLNGTNGVNGLNGSNGINGTNGVNGLNGTNGSNGQNATANWTAKDGIGDNFVVGNGITLTLNATGCFSAFLSNASFNLSVNQSCLALLYDPLGAAASVNTSQNIQNLGFNTTAQLTNLFCENNGTDCRTQNAGSGWLNTTSSVYLANNATNVSIGQNLYLPGGNGTDIVLNPGSGPFGESYIQMAGISLSNPTGRARIGYNGSLNSGSIVLDDGGTNKNMMLSVTDNTTTNNIQFSVGPNHVIIDSNGNLGLGMLNPTMRLSVNGSQNVSNNISAGGIILENGSRVCTGANRLCENVTAGITGNFTVINSVNLLALTSTSCVFRFQNGTLRSTTC